MNPIFRPQSEYYNCPFFGAHFMNDIGLEWNEEKQQYSRKKSPDLRKKYNARFDGIFVVTETEIRPRSEIYVDYQWGE